NHCQPPHLRSGGSGRGVNHETPPHGRDPCKSGDGIHLPRRFVQQSEAGETPESSSARFPPQSARDLDQPALLKSFPFLPRLSVRIRVMISSTESSHTFTFVFWGFFGAHGNLVCLVQSGLVEVVSAVFPESSGGETLARCFRTCSDWSGFSWFWLFCRFQDQPTMRPPPPESTSLLKEITEHKQ
ncbi:hypothetical protein QTP70_023161, partial [Hemibagrus guttatus]